MSALIAATADRLRRLQLRPRGRRDQLDGQRRQGAAQPSTGGGGGGGGRPGNGPAANRAPAADTAGRPTTNAWPGGPAVIEGLVAAGLGLGLLAVVVLVLWTVSPHPDDGPGTATAVAVDLWLLAHGAALVRTETLSGTPAPIGITPLLLALLPGWLLRRAMRVAMRPESEPYDALRTALWVCCGYLLVAAGALLYTLDGPIRADPVSAAAFVPAFALVLTVVAGWSHTGPPLLPARAQWLQETDAPRAAAAGLAAMCGAGAVLAAVALVGHAGAAQDLFGQLAGDWSGRIALLLLGCALVPNAAVWAASYGLGPGFTVGGGVVLSPLAAGTDTQLPPFPLLAALPGDGRTLTTVLLAALVPLAGIVVTATFLGRSAVPVRADRTTATTARGTACAALIAAALLGTGMALLALLAGGPIGTGDLAAFGPQPWLTGLAAFGWTAVLGT
ncbi:DUF6350 family protein, partial [Streptomyces sp. SM12]|uniref:cell division protein PerM n=1 Tax=Streptomyces sp. SM12 TaxID=1071602 RepID=UPI00215625D3